MHFWLVELYLVVAGVIGGLLSTIAGMASLVSYPVLLSVGLPPVTANVTNTTAQIFTGIGSTLSSAKELKSAQHATAMNAVFSLFGSLCGCILLLVAPAATFAKAVPFLIAFAGCLMFYTLLRQTPPTGGQAHPILKSVALFLVGIYIGYFGASAGVITLAILTVTEQLPFTTINAIKNFISFTGNGLAMIIFAFTADVRWTVALTMGIGFLVGGWLGPRIVRHLPIRKLRFAIAFAALGLAAYLFVTTY
ncbi:sulfite exporter TauE/SafE family protein [Loigolactobacillus bifermentans]|nr:sulfite exporter TauE/SafE family protein [Loigolactobacillus bifermentans]QGG60203.1 TSUP family transporter [Loigolactobacillus bifermentans]